MKDIQWVLASEVMQGQSIEDVADGAPAETIDENPSQMNEPAIGNHMDDAVEMQTQDGTATPSPSTPALHDSVVGGDGTNQMAWVSAGLVVGAILLAMFGVMSDAWAVQEESSTILGVTISVESEVGLDDMSMTSCLEDNCTTVINDLSSAYDNCTSAAEELEYNKTQQDEVCGELGETASAGFTGMILISIGILVMLATLVTSFMEFRGTKTPYSQYYPFGGAGFVLLGVIAWYAMMPEGDASLGLGAWLTIVSIILAAAAGGSSMYFGENSNGGDATSTPWKMQERRYRSEGEAVRATMTNSDITHEFILREAIHGQKSSSLIVEGNLLRLVTTERDTEGNITIEDKLILQRSALQGFTHMRLDWLDSGKYAWWGMGVAGLVLPVVGVAAAGSLLVPGIILSLLQWADPEVFTFETSSGRYRQIIWRLGSNLELTGASMNCLDGIMKQLLQGDEIDTSELDQMAGEIDVKLSALMAESEQEKMMRAKAKADSKAEKKMQKELAKKAKLEAKEIAKQQAVEQQAAEQQAAIIGGMQMAEASPQPLPANMQDPSTIQPLPAQTIAAPISNGEAINSEIPPQDGGISIPPPPPAPPQAVVLGEEELATDNSAELPPPPPLPPTITNETNTELPPPPPPPPSESSSQPPLSELPLPSPEPPVIIPPPPSMMAQLPPPEMAPLPLLPPLSSGLPPPPTPSSQNMPPPPPPLSSGLPPPPPPLSHGADPMDNFEREMGTSSPPPALMAPVVASPRVDTMSSAEKNELLNALGD